MWRVGAPATSAVWRGVCLAAKPGGHGSKRRACPVASSALPTTALCRFVARMEEAAPPEGGASGKGTPTVGGAGAPGQEPSLLPASSLQLGHIGRSLTRRRESRSEMAADSLRRVHVSAD